MPQPRVLILRAPGTNCDMEAQFAFERAGGMGVRVHMNRLLESPQIVRDFQIFCLPGGFSYGDDIAAGRILANQIRRRLAESLQEFKADGKLIVGICNGFQVLIKSGILLPIDEGGAATATLTWNDSGKFEDRWVPLVVPPTNKSVFFAGIERMYLPVAHAEGKFVPRSREVFDRLSAAGQIVLQYGQQPAGAGADLSPNISYPENPNGSLGDVAGVCDETGRVCGLMPHPERHIDPTHHPRWARGTLPAAGEGLRFFQNAVAYFK